MLVETLFSLLALKSLLTVNLPELDVISVSALSVADLGFYVSEASFFLSARVEI